MKKRILKALEQLQLADNEMSRLGILGKSANLDEDDRKMLEAISALVTKMSG